MNNATTSPLESILADLKDAREQSSKAKSLAYFSEQEAARASRSANLATASPDGWKPVSPGFRGVRESLALAEVIMTSAHTRAENAEAHAKDAFQVLTALESKLHKLQQALQDLAEVKPC